MEERTPFLIGCFEQLKRNREAKGEKKRDG